MAKSDDLRERIRRLFAGELPQDEIGGRRREPAYWVPPGNEVAKYRGEAVPCEAERTATQNMDSWLESPHPMLGGQTPKKLLESRNQAKLKTLEKAVAAIEQDALT